MVFPEQKDVSEGQFSVSEGIRCVYGVRWLVSEPRQAICGVHRPICHVHPVISDPRAVISEVHESISECQKAISEAQKVISRPVIEFTA